MGSVRGGKNFDELFAENVSSTLHEVLGDSAAEAMLFHLGRLDNGQGPKGLANSLKKILGTGSAVVEKLILKNLSNKLGAAIDDAQQMDFAGSIAHLRDEFTRGKEEA